MKIAFLTSIFLIWIKVPAQQVEELNPELIPSMDLTRMWRDSIRKTAEVYKKAKEKLLISTPLTKKEAALMNEIEVADDITLDMYLEESIFYYVGPGYGCNYYENGGPDSIWSSSTLSDKYNPDNICDGSLDFAWAEGKEDNGMGESILMRMTPNAWPLEKIIIYNGYQKDIMRWKKNNRVKQLMLYVDNSPVAKLNLKDVTDGQVFDVSKWFAQREQPYFIRLEIVKTYKGGTYNDTVISEISFDGPVIH